MCIWLRILLRTQTPQASGELGAVDEQGVELQTDLAGGRIRVRQP